jgi:hypothetical protein
MPCVSKFALRTVTAGARDIPAGCEHPRQLTARCTAPRAWRIASCGSTPRDKLARCASPTSCENPLHPGHFSGVSSARSGRAVAHDCLGSANLVHFVAVAALGARCDLHRGSDSVVGLFSFVTLRVAAVGQGHRAGHDVSCTLCPGFRASTRWRRARPNPLQPRFEVSRH